MLHIRNTVLPFFICLNIFSHLNVFSYGCPQHEVEGKNDDSDSVSNNMKMICYYGSWSVYRPGNGKFPVEAIDPFLCSHLIYAFAGLGHDYKIRALDPYNDLKENYGKGAFLKFTALKNINKNLKTLIAIGGWNEGSIKYSNMVAKPETRKIFVDSVVAFIDKYGFDGIDVDWEYPASRGGKPEDKQNFVALLRELNQALSPRGYLLTAAVSAGKWNIDPAYDIPQISEYLDLINIMCYDYHGGWENKTGHNSPLYPRPDEVENDRISNVNFSVNYWISRGAPKNKIILGMGTYGRSFTLQRAENNGLGAPAPQTGQAGPYTREGGTLGYNEICEMRYNNEQWNEVRDPYHLAPYAYKDRQWVGYDDVESITIKAQYIKAMQLAGGMIWSIETDDFSGKCGEKYPLLNAINKVFRSDSVVMPLPKPSDSAKPSRPPAKPSTPSTKPSTPWTKPSTPSTKPSTPWTKPSTPSTKPSTSWTKPSTPSSMPTMKPSSSTTMSSSSPSSTTSTSSSTPSSSSTTWTSSTPSSSSTKWPWAPTHPTPSSSTTVNSVETTEGQNTDKFFCKSAGVFRDPQDCQKFYRCVDSTMEGKYRLFHNKCPENTVFSPQRSLCDWVANVPECQKKVHKHLFRNIDIFKSIK